MAHESSPTTARRPRAESLAARASADVSRLTAVWFAFGLVTTLLLLLAAAYLAI